MARKTKSASPTNQVPLLALSELHIHLEGLEKEHQSLLKQIKRKRTELNNFVEQMRSLATEVFHQATPCFKKMADLDQEIHALFKEIFTTRKFGKQTQKNIEGLYLNLQMSGIISTKSAQEEDNDTELDELFENSENDDEHNQNRHQYWESRNESESTSASRTEESRKVRQTFLKLAEIFHPDKVQDSETHKSHTEIMKEINKAYQEGDLARLLEIERQHQLGESIDSNSEDDLTRRCKNLEQQNEILKTQYEKLKQELRLAKNTPEGSMVSDSRKAAKQGINSVDLMLETLDSQINIIVDIRDFIKDFREQKITIKEFLAGPPSLRSSREDMMEKLLEEMMQELGGVIIF
ncbi:J domain-containing protein [Anabaena cylindrica FACHB-243]|uniref:Heat shock protein DnaJ domain protein n=1 Tax=Anabaena cylindrica (strain ATCC 27899 / PCC 7122) TaxID=272123 RepID=K9ZDH6_ANACC|nr:MULTISPECIES: J domain-containing protein [Anabaena]AFZ56430.1 heat shock protein DnaJ domain protein [Anabaena cylindrica PCC 7122]MBD2418119.1 J domain-containing protein [Anabaena cylindrica FACHB-243]MBY5281965.1 J domain-containing protein [Anabaena sp. CCAP 1446/1C]MBY5311230.1 J domain-containing protein [Anabaena sp. CCAP 1446/1C]MCM2407397.1 J domain-containing protein [Anabaena sp. CCAP 1446/1C]